MKFFPKAVIVSLFELQLHCFNSTLLPRDYEPLVRYVRWWQSAPKSEVAKVNKQKKTREPRNKQILSDFNAHRASYVSLIILAGRVLELLPNWCWIQFLDKRYHNQNISPWFAMCHGNLCLCLFPLHIVPEMEQWKYIVNFKVKHYIADTGFHHQVLPSREGSHIPPNGKRKRIDSKMPTGRGYVPRC